MALTPVIIGGDTISTTDLTRRLWLNNKFYGVTYNFKISSPKQPEFYTWAAPITNTKARIMTILNGRSKAPISRPIINTARNDADKTDFNIFGKADYQIGKVTCYADMQYRHIYYSFLGFDENLNNVQQQVKLDFFNPKAGITYQFDPQNNVYASFAVVTMSLTGTIMCNQPRKAAQSRKT